MDPRPQAVRFEELLQHASWVRSLARALVRDPAEAEDLVQETWLSALRTPPRDRRHLKGWLSRTLRNALRQRARSGARRSEREQERPSEPVPTPDELVGRMEVQRLLAEEVMALAEPLRSTILLRFYEGLSAPQIAAAQRVAPGTVRWRIHEGLGRLRQSLDARHKDQSSWVLALAPLAGSSTASGAKVTGLLGGAMAMKLSVKLAASAAVALLLLGWGTWSALEPDRGSAPIPHDVAVVVRESPTAASGMVGERTGISEPPVLAAAKPDATDSWPEEPTNAELDAFAGICPPGTIEGIVLRGRVPVAGGFAWLGAESSGGLPWAEADAWDRAPQVRRTQIGRDGLFRFDDLASGGYTVGIRTPDGAERRMHLSLNVDEPSARLRIVLGSSGIRGHVYDEHAVPAEGWVIAAYNWGNTLAGLQLISRKETDKEGAFSFEELAGGSYILIASPSNDGSDPSELRKLFVELAPREQKIVTIGNTRGACVWTGRVLLPRGEPLHISGLTELRVQAGGVRHNAALSEGSFKIDLPGGRYDLSLFAHGGGGGASAELGSIDLPSGAFERDVSLPVAFVRLRAIYSGSKSDPKLALSNLSAKLELALGKGVLTAVYEPSGSYCFLAVPPGEHKLSCSRPILGAPQGKLLVRVGETEAEIEVDITVGDR